MANNTIRWVRGISAVVAIIIGLMLLGKPYQALELLPIVVVISVVLAWMMEPRAPIAWIMTIYLAALAITALISPFWSVALALYGALIWMASAGVERLLTLRQRQWGSAAYGLGLVLLAVSGVYWLDLASIILGLLIGPGLVIVGVILLWRAFDLKHPNGGRMGMILGRVGAAIVVVLAVTISMLTLKVVSSTPELDGFSTYSEPLGNEPGILLASEPLTQGMPANSAAYRILYTTTGLDGDITLATGLVVLPEPAPDADVPMILWAHGTTGVASHCAPTLLDDPLGSGAMLFPERALEQGWAIVAPDYLGLGTDGDAHPYMVGVPTAQSALDAARAARQMESVRFSNDTVVWGHSQGGGAAIWIGIEQPTYAPDVPLLGVVAMSPATDLSALADTLLTSQAGPIFGGFMVQGYAAAYDDVSIDDLVRPGARFSQKRVVDRCLSDYSTIASLASALVSEDWTRGNLEETTFYGHLGENVPEATLGIPLFVGQGLTDTLILPEIQGDYVARLCDQGQIVEFHRYIGRDHMGVVQEDSPMLDDVIDWTIARFNHDAAPATCTMPDPE